MGRKAKGPESRTPRSQGTPGRPCTTRRLSLALCAHLYPEMGVFVCGTISHDDIPRQKGKGSKVQIHKVPLPPNSIVRLLPIQIPSVRIHAQDARISPIYSSGG